MIGFALRAEYADTYTGGVIAIAGDKSFDVAAELEQGGGTIVVNPRNLLLVNALDAYPALKRVAVEDGAEVTASRYDAMVMSELRAEADRLGMTIHGSIKKADLVEAFKTRDRRIDGGDTDLLTSPPAIAEDGTLIAPDAA